MKTQKPQLPNLVSLRSIPGGELVSCAEYKNEILFVPSKDNMMMDLFDGEDDQVVVFNIETGEPRQLSIDTTVIWHKGSKLTVAVGSSGDAAPASVQEKAEGRSIAARYSLKEQSQLEYIIRVLRDSGKIQAIKFHRQYSGLGLKESKQIIDQLESDIKYGMI